MRSNNTRESSRKKNGGRSSQGRRPASRPRGDVGHGIKSGMTVEDLKRLTQERMKAAQAAQSSPVSSAQTTRLNSPLNPKAKPVAPPMSMMQQQQQPKSGMTVQQLKELTNLRYAGAHQPEVNSVVNKAIMSNVAKSHFRDTLGSSSKSERRVNPPPLYTMNLGSPATPSGPLSPRGAQLHKVAGLYRDGTLSGEEKARAKDILIHESISALRNIGNLEIPPPPSSSATTDEPAPSWSPPPASKKSIKSTGSASFFQRGDYEKANNEQNKMVEPPPGMARRPSMTVPWMVAESVLDTPQGGTRKTFGEDGVSAAANARRGSFENAAEFFKFRRRSKSRLDFARDVIQNDVNGQMPGIAEVDSSSSDIFNISEYGSMPKMSPNGAKLRQMAELHRRGSLSHEDKVREKDKMISKSFRGADNMALIGKIKMKMSDRLTKARKSLEGRPPTARSPGKPSGDSDLRPPPGFQSSPPRPNRAGIRRSSGSASRSPTRSENSQISSCLEDRLAEAGKRVATCVANSNMDDFSDAMAELDQLKLEAKVAMKSQQSS